MQTLDVISVNLWQILISLGNLCLLFWLIKKFLYKPVKNILAKRQSELEEHYVAAENAEADARASRASWEEKLAGADAEADAILKRQPITPPIAASRSLPKRRSRRTASSALQRLRLSLNARRQPMASSARSWTSAARSLKRCLSAR